MSDGPPCVLIADDELDIRGIFSDCLKRQGCKVIMACDGKEAMGLAAAHPLDLALIDVWMPPPSGMALAAQLKELHPNVKVIIITAYGSIDEATEALRRGAFHYLPKPISMKQLVATVEEALATRGARTQTRAGKSVTDLTRKGTSDLAQGEKEDAGLTPRQLQVLRLISQGMTNKEIAAELDLSEKTIGNYVSAILRILSVNNRTAAAIRARDLGIL